MSAYLSHAPMLQSLEAENTSAFPQAPQVLEPAPASRPRFAAAALLRRAARLELALAARLEQPTPRRLAPA